MPILLVCFFSVAGIVVFVLLASIVLSAIYIEPATAFKRAVMTGKIEDKVMFRFIVQRMKLRRWPTVTGGVRLELYAPVAGWELLREYDNNGWDLARMEEDVARIWRNVNAYKAYKALIAHHPEAEILANPAEAIDAPVASQPESTV